MHKYAYTIHYKQFACDCPVWDTHNRRALLKFLLCYRHYGLIGIHNKTCNISIRFAHLWTSSRPNSSLRTQTRAWCW